ITVLEYKPPTGTVEANPSEVYAGDKSTLSARFEGQCGGPIQEPIYSVSEGTVQGNEFDSSGITFDPALQSEQRKGVNVTAKAADNRTTGAATTTITVIQKAATAAVRLPDVLFPARSSRVNNCGKRVLLEQLRTYFERDPAGKAVLVGHNT